MVSGNIITHLDTIINAMPSEAGENDYVAPNSSARSTWRTVIQNILSGDYSAAHTTAATITYQVTEFSDTTTTPNITYYILERTSEATTNYWGTFIYNPSPLRQKLFIQCPHPLNDTNTGMEGIHIFRYCGARAYYTSGTERCNSSVYSTCDGTTTTCSDTSESFRDSDQAHITQGTLHITTEELESAITDMVVIQPHGFSKGDGDPDLILSNGTNQTPDPDYLSSLKNNLTIYDSTLTFKVGHIDTSWSRLLGTTNMQGRYINGITSPCNTSSSSTTGRFLHVEQAYSKLRNNLTSWNKVGNAIAMTIPLDNVLANDQILEFDGSDDYIINVNDAALQKLDGATNYTLETWLFISNENDIDEYDIILMRENGFHLRLKLNLVVSFGVFRGGSTWSYYSSSDNAITVGQWNHIAVIRDTGPDPITFKILVNGSDVSSATWTGYSMQSGGGDLYIGRRETAIRHLKGYVDEIRLKNNAEYSSNLHATVNSAPYSWDGNTAALFHFDEGSGSSVTSNVTGHRATLGTSSTGDAAEPIWRSYDYLQQDLSLPVELILFTAQQEENSVVLKWVTESEFENLGFILERRVVKIDSIISEWQEITSYITNREITGQGSATHRTDYRFVDNVVSAGVSYDYQLVDVSYNGEVTYHGLASLTVEPFPEIPDEFTLYQNYPNPFNPKTVISFILPEKQTVTLAIYNLFGQEVATPLKKVQSNPGLHQLIFESRSLSSGIYFYRINTDKWNATRKMLVVK